jgi:hypothetical protein
VVGEEGVEFTGGENKIGFRKGSDGIDELCARRFELSIVAGLDRNVIDV